MSVVCISLAVDDAGGGTKSKVVDSVLAVSSVGQTVVLGV
jgi:hypothetical protein